ncbi:coiled-coil domain-containing protein 34-like [Ischnura elegans]|uniref:coiled-coil domain-containing protein 34-like n=1 Tax=Ischnura elegans TaxID=197161 RepID=UPI001ED8A0AF|nr:coiled-coil domain-containing protein 34-like [Ischnura elegans]XP_046389601.1 coiled-coil domain-containing protein 34-like [Ischnura elegans]
MSKVYTLKPTDDSDEDDTCVLNLDGFASDDDLDIDKSNLSPSHYSEVQDNLAEGSSKTVNRHETSHRKVGTIENVSKGKRASNNSTYSDVSTPPMDSKSFVATPKTATLSKETSRVEVSYSPDFTEVSEQTEDKMTAWERWFVMKQRQIRLQTEMEKKKKMVEEQKVLERRRKKAEENERLQKLWLEKKKMEDFAKKEREKAMNTKNDKGKANELFYEKWCQKKLQEKQSKLQYNKEQEKYEELQKEIRKKKNEKAQMEWMNKAKQRPMTPRITFGYVGDSVIAFHDSTSHPPPTYVNPIPWQL